MIGVNDQVKEFEKKMGKALLKSIYVEKDKLPKYLQEMLPKEKEKAKSGRRFLGNLRDRWSKGGKQIEKKI